MKKLRKTMIILAIVFIIILIGILIMYKTLKSGENMKNYESDVSGDFDKSMGKIADYRTFFSVEKMLSKYVKYATANNKEAVYNLLDGIYIQQNNITIENVLDYMSQYGSQVKVREAYGEENIDNAVYYVECILEQENKGESFNFVLYEDKQNLTYSVEQISKEKYNQKIQETNSVIERKVIEKNEYNKTEYKNPSEEEIVTKYFEDFVQNALYYNEYAYNTLDLQYKNKCFPSQQDFQDYIENKKDLLLSYDATNLKSFGEFESGDIQEYLNYIGTAKKLEIESYKIKKQNEGNKYMCIDTEGNYYTFYAKTPLDYTVILDTYAILTDDAKEEYNTSSDTEKVVLNIKRFFMGIDDKNYGYSYSVLSESFKNNKYPTKNDFINYAKQNFFEKNEIEYVSYEKENGLYIYKIKIKDATGSSSEEKTFNMILKLNSGTDFEMSFGEN